MGSGDDMNEHSGRQFLVCCKPEDGMKGLPVPDPVSLICSAMSAPAEVSVYSKDHPFPALVTENRMLTKPGSAKETRHFVVSIAGSGLHYKAGDSLGVFPTNRPSEVNELLERLGASGDELVSPVMLKLPAPITLREALSSRLALSSPTQKIVATLAAKATNADEKAHLTG
jgi:sulfite reductase (NADPH) flavoprotein alpha-component